MKRIETSLLAELKAEKDRAEQELGEMLEAFEELEREKEALGMFTHMGTATQAYQAKASSNPADIEGKITEIQAQAQQDCLKLENKVGGCRTQKLTT